MNHVNRALLGASIAAIAVAGQAHAQAVAPAADAPSQQPVEVETANQAPDSNDIVVTANKREQRLNDVGITVAVVSGAEPADQLAGGSCKRDTQPLLHEQRERHTGVHSARRRLLRNVDRCLSDRQHICGRSAARVSSPFVPLGV